MNMEYTRVAILPQSLHLVNILKFCGMEETSICMVPIPKHPKLEPSVLVSSYELSNPKVAGSNPSEESDDFFTLPVWKNSEELQSMNTANACLSSLRAIHVLSYIIMYYSHSVSV